MNRLSLDETNGDSQHAMEESKEMNEMAQARRAPHVLTKPKPDHDEDNRSAPKAQLAPPQPTTNASNSLSNFADYDELRSKYEDIKKEYRVLHRENRESTVEIRDLKRQNASLIEAYTAIQKEIQSGGNATGNATGSKALTKSERVKVQEYIEFIEGKAEYFHHEFRKRENHLLSLTKQTREANNEKDLAEDESRKLQRKIRDLQASLTECRDDLLRLQPPSQMSDSELSDMYSNLCQHVATWVDDQTEDPDIVEKYFDGLKGVGELPADVRTELNQRHFKLAKQHPECLPLLIQYIIHGRLKEEVLGPNIYVYGLEEVHVAILQGIEEGMHDLEPKRDAPTIRRWRSETLQGLLKMEVFAEEQRQCGEQLAQDLASTLTTMLGTTPTSPISWQDLHSQIVRPAITLANAIRVSTTDYQFFSHFFARPQSQPDAVHRNEIQHYQMVDNATQKVIRPDSAIKVNEEGKIGEEMFVVSPGMVRSLKDGMERSVLVKPCVLVKLDEPMGRKKGLKPLANWGLGWLGGSEEA